MAVRRPRRRGRYDRLRELHFTHGEALELSRLRYTKKKVPTELKVMVRQRDALWLSFVKQATDNGWGKTRQGIEWRNKVADFYVKRNFRGKEEIRIGAFRFGDLSSKDVFLWFDQVRSRLPVDLRWDSPRKHSRMSRKERRAKAQAERGRAVERRVQEIRLKEFMKEVVRQPHLDKQLSTTARNFGFKNKSLLATARKRGIR